MTTATAGHRVLSTAIDAARRETDRLFAVVDAAALYERPVEERHRLIFYLGHLEAFDWNQIGRSGLDLKPFRPEFDKLFEFGIDPAVGSKQRDQPGDWPEVEEVHDYNRRTRAILDEVMGDAPPELLNIALEHRLMHAETLAYLLHRLPYGLKSGPAPRVDLAPKRFDNPMLEIPDGVATLGIRRGREFGWDNEFEEYTVDVPAFRISRYNIANADYLEFVRKGGAAPPFWTNRDGNWRLRCMFGEIELPLHWPVYVTQQQASAFVASRGLTLPTEQQFHRAAYGSPEGVERQFPWGETAGEFADGNFDFRGWDPVSVDATNGGDSAFGVAQTVGNGWEWTSTVFAPFDGFRHFPTYPGYSANFFDGQHFVLKGGSARTAARLLRRSFRNWFRPDYPHVYAGFRLVENR